MALNTSLPYIEDVQYDASSQANLPTVGVNGANFTTFSLTSTQPTGNEVGGQPVTIGNSTNGNNGAPGTICEIMLWKTTPSAAAVEAMRRNESRFYGFGGSVH